MSVSNVQAYEAKIFLTSYRDALQTLQQSSRDIKMKKTYDNFLNDVIDWQNNNKLMNEDLMRRITMFQYSHYFFLKKFKNLAKPETISFEDFISSVKNASLI